MIYNIESQIACIPKDNRKVEFLIIGITKKVIIENGGDKNIQEEYRG